MLLILLIASGAIVGFLFRRNPQHVKTLSFRETYWRTGLDIVKKHPWIFPPNRKVLSRGLDCAQMSRKNAGARGLSSGVRVQFFFRPCFLSRCAANASNRWFQSARR